MASIHTVAHHVYCIVYIRGAVVLCTEICKYIYIATVLGWVVDFKHTHIHSARYKCVLTMINYIHTHGVFQTNKSKRLYTATRIMPIAYVQKMMEEHVYMNPNIYILQ